MKKKKAFTLAEVLISLTIIGVIAAIKKSCARMYCAALIMKDGWQIKDDYPW